jgi:hypothetical protein
VATKIKLEHGGKKLSQVKNLNTGRQKLVKKWSRQLKIHNVSIRQDLKLRNLKTQYCLTCGAMRTSGQAAFLAILIRSDRELDAA